MTTLVKDYLLFAEELLWRRAVSNLTVVEERQLSAAMDRLWRQMSDEEQDEIEPAVEELKAVPEVTHIALEREVKRQAPEDETFDCRAA